MALKTIIYLNKNLDPPPGGGLLIFTDRDQQTITGGFQINNVFLSALYMVSKKRPTFK